MIMPLNSALSAISWNWNRSEQSVRAYTPIRVPSPEETAMEFEFQVQNVKCQGCASAIRAGLGQNPGVREVQVDVPTGRVMVQAENDIRAELGAALKELGYPEKG
jgi:copper chaperone